MEITHEPWLSPNEKRTIRQQERERVIEALRNVDREPEYVYQPESCDNCAYGDCDYGHPLSLEPFDSVAFIKQMDDPYVSDVCPYCGSDDLCGWGSWRQCDGCHRDISDTGPVPGNRSHLPVCADERRLIVNALTHVTCPIHSHYEDNCRDCALDASMFLLWIDDNDGPWAVADVIEKISPTLVEDVSLPF